MIEEKDIIRLSKEQRQEILDTGGKLGLYKPEALCGWQERIYVTRDRYAKNLYNSSILPSRDFHEWQAPPDENTKRSCSHCKYKNYGGAVEPCFSCSTRLSNWEAIPKIRPMTALEIAKFIAKTGYVLCNKSGKSIIYNATLYALGDVKPPNIENYRYLKPDSDELFKFDEVQK